MKILNSAPISSFGGFNFVLEEFQELKLKQLIISELHTSVQSPGGQDITIIEIGADLEDVSAIFVLLQ